MDPQYYTDFWTVPGYLGMDPAASVHRERIQLKTVVQQVYLGRPAGQPAGEQNAEDDPKTGVDDAWHRLLQTYGADGRIGVLLAQAPSESAYLKGLRLTITSGNAAGKSFLVESVAGQTAILGSHADAQILEQLAPGDEAILDNSNYLAMQTYHRHQVPESSGFDGFDQFRDEDGQPIYPQRAVAAGPMISRGGCGSLQTGRFAAKMISVCCLQDESAFPWNADWYRRQVRQQAGEQGEQDTYRLWFVDHAMHGDVQNTPDPSRIVPYLGVLNQALLDLSAWVEKGISPADSTSYRVQDSQVILTQERATIQPLVRVKLPKPGSPFAVDEVVDFQAEIELPPQTVLVSAEWDFDGDGNYSRAAGQVQLDAGGLHATTTAQHVYKRPGTYFAGLRVQINRAEKPQDFYAKVYNLDRVRVVVE